MAAEHHLWRRDRKLAVLASAAECTNLGATFDDDDDRRDETAAADEQTNGAQTGWTGHFLLGNVRYLLAVGGFND